MKIAVLGTRGFPGVQGGVESHCERLYSKLSELGCDVTVFTRKPYVDSKIKSYNSINLIAIDCPKSRTREAIIHTFKGVFAARKINPDIVHFHAVGPALMIPLVRILGMKAVMTTQGPDYKRKKWGVFAKFILRLGEKLGAYFSNAIISVASYIAEDIRKKYHRDSYVIPNGVEIHEILKSDEALKRYSLEKGRYILTVGRFVPEKRFDDLINAFEQAKLKNMKLVIVGRADHAGEYSRSIEKKAKKDKNIILTGYLSGRSLKELYSHARFFVLPSSYEGLPIALLEAMSYGLLCLASDIPANRYVGLPFDNYFAPGNIEELNHKLREFSQKKLSSEDKSRQIEMLKKDYSWDEVAKKTLEVYQKVLKK